MLKRSQKGFTIVSVLIAAGIMSVVLMGTMQMLTFLNSANRSLELKGDKESMRRFLLERTSCSTTLGPNAAASCPQGQLIDLKARHLDGSEVVVISKDGTKPGNGSWTYRAEGDADASIIVRATLLKRKSAIKSGNADDFYPDPMTKKTVTWNDPESLLFPAGQTLCGSNGSRPVTVVTGTYEGTCYALTWFLCGRTQEVKLSGRPVYVQIFNVNDKVSANITPFSATKFDTMTGDSGWQSLTAFQGSFLPTGPIMNYFTASIAFKDNSFFVRKAANINFRGPFGFLHTRYHYVAFIEQ